MDVGGEQAEHGRLADEKAPMVAVGDRALSSCPGLVIL